MVLSMIDLKLQVHKHISSGSLGVVTPLHLMGEAWRVLHNIILMKTLSNIGEAGSHSYEFSHIHYDHERMPTSLSLDLEAPQSSGSYRTIDPRSNARFGYLEGLFDAVCG